MPVINKYNNSMIYTIRSPATDKYYIGSTTQILCKRFSDHNINYKSYLKGTSNFMTSFKIIELGDSYIELLELYPCNLKAELHKREGELIREHKANCVNRNIAGRAKKEYRIDNIEKSKAYREAHIDKEIQYRIDNKDKIKKQSKQYRLDNVEIITKKNKQFKIDNKESISKHSKQYYKNNIESIKAKASLQYLCACGLTLRTDSKAKHNKSAKHLKALEQEIIIV
jgi:GIY-YIG catalytic domain